MKVAQSTTALHVIRLGEAHFLDAKENRSFEVSCYCTTICKIEAVKIRVHLLWVQEKIIV
jgi:hypothetical protein